MARNGSLDISRVLAAFGIVLFHAKAPGGVIGYAGLPFLLMVLLVLAIPVARIRDYSTFSKDRAFRLLRPWLIWSAFYGGLKLLEVLLTTKTLQSEFSISMLLTGTALHLWFLPFAFVLSLSVPAIVGLWDRAGHAGHIGMTSACLALCLISLGWQQGKTLPVPLAQYCYILPAAGLGLAIGLNWEPRDARWQGILASSACLGLATALGYREGLLQLSVACSALLLCLAFPLPDTGFSRLCAKYSLTVYLLHPLALSLLDRMLHLPLDSLLRPLIAMATSLIAAVLLDYRQYGLPRSRIKTS